MISRRLLLSLLPAPLVARISPPSPKRYDPRTNRDSSKDPVLNNVFDLLDYYNERPVDGKYSVLVPNEVFDIIGAEGPKHRAVRSPVMSTLYGEPVYVVVGRTQSINVSVNKEVHEKMLELGKLV